MNCSPRLNIKRINSGGQNSGKITTSKIGISKSTLRYVNNFKSADQRSLSACNEGHLFSGQRTLVFASATPPPHSPIPSPTPSHIALAPLLFSSIDGDGTMKSRRHSRNTSPALGVFREKTLA